MLALSAAAQRQGIAARNCQSIHACRPAAPVKRRVARVAALFGSKPKTTSSKAPAKRETIIPEPSYNIPLTLLALAGLGVYEGNTAVATLAGILGVFLTIQASRVKFVFEDDAFEVLVSGKEEQATENAFVGGRNRWRYDTFINWEMWWPGFPVLFYFKESQTKPEGQIHFFPIIFNGTQLYNVAKERCGPSATTK